jgi:hypothetical protein
VTDGSKLIADTKSSLYYEVTYWSSWSTEFHIIRGIIIIDKQIDNNINKSFVIKCIFNLQNNYSKTNLRFGYENWLSDNSLAVPYNTKKLEKRLTPRDILLVSLKSTDRINPTHTVNDRESKLK